MDLKQLEYFVRVAELRSFTRASIAIDVAQPALSRQIRQLEVELRQNLLVRHGRGVEMTEAGELFLEYSRGILHQVEHAKEEMGRLRGALSGRVAVGLPPSIARRFTVPLSRAFRQRLPDATLSITESLSSAMQASLIAGRLDIALIYNPIPSQAIDSTFVLEEDLYLVGSTKFTSNSAPLPLVELAAHPLIIPTRPNAIRTIVDSELANIGQRPTISMEIDGVAAILDLVGDGVGEAVLSLNAVQMAPDPHSFVTRKIVSPVLHSRLAMAISAQRPHTLTQKAAGELVREIIGGAKATATSLLGDAGGANRL